jgi:hypothetical protein
MLGNEVTLEFKAKSLFSAIAASSNSVTCIDRFQKFCAYFIEVLLDLLFGFYRLIRCFLGINPPVALQN